MALSKTWEDRLRRLRSASRTAGRAAIAVGALLGAIAACQVFITPQRPDIAGIARQTDNQAAQVGSFAKDFIVTWLTATAADRAALQRFITIPAEKALPSTPPYVVTSPNCHMVAAPDTVGDMSIYTAIVSVMQRPYASAPPTLAFYQVPISMWHRRLRVIGTPTARNDPGPGADIKTAYTNALSSDSPLYSLVSGFVAAYLTSTSGLDRYVTAGSGLAPIGGYQTAVVTSAATDRRIPEHPAPKERIHLQARVSAQTSQFAAIDFSYPLTVENSDGTWMVAAIDLSPQISPDTEPKPVSAGHS
ncbi:conjugal transfer protein [Mycobacterium branderi]|nr:conjugal transfer protein [Mycobacterium branderi]MCV7231821.1 conjugal transfer protein [Mycobacterium branderi]ORA40227.1 hypothetical protein BST20_06605 [Mycobacterium branderi]